MNSNVSVVEECGAFLRLDCGGFIVRRHTAPLGAFHPDFVAVAERFVGTPYLWGGKTRLGVDCSGLVQTAMHAAGLDCPRDSDMQAAGLGAKLGRVNEPRRGDFLFWQGHIATMVDSARLIHATAHHMEVAVEPRDAVVARNLAAGLPLLAMKRPARLGKEPARALRVLFLSTANAARGQLAEALLNRVGGDALHASSAGRTPKNAVAPPVLELLRSLGLPVEGLRPKSLAELAASGQRAFDIVIDLDETEHAPTESAWPGETISVRWPLADPDTAASRRSARAQAAAYADTNRQLAHWIDALCALPMPLLDRSSRVEMIERIRLARQA